MRGQKKNYSIKTIIALIAVIAISVSSAVLLVDEINAKTEESKPGFHQNEDGSVVYYKKNLKKAKGWLNIKGSRYYFNKKTGKMYTGWHKINGNKYYFSLKTGKAYKGWHKINGKKYYFGKKYGGMLKGVHKIGKHKYYFSYKTGQLKKNCLIKRKGKVYNIDKKGRIRRTLYTKKKAIALTYDDGPADGTKSIVNTLKKNDGLATFFVVGNRLSPYSSSLKYAYNAGCQIGNHSYSHPWLSDLSASEIRSQMNKCNKAVKKRTGEKPTVCRTPGGEQYSTILNNVGMPVILWSIDTLDWKTRDADDTYNTVINHAYDGAIVLMHDLHESTATASKRIIPKLKKKGYQLVTVEELALLKGKKLKAGKVYYDMR